MVVLLLQVHFQPQEAAAFKVAAACSLDNGELLTVQVRSTTAAAVAGSDCVTSHILVARLMWLPGLFS